ncbi:MAG: hypothetical protein A2Y17_04785 [Clostridiales bacterium GWF2_38_85]|nr:MAG: hypothetical protein A2Y17_04785 [Clostridiales bacterium GWF2_38_85]HBL84397.1 hypothetical protein [Clostridiales bacterium]
MKINNYSEFCAYLLECGFSMGGGNSKGIFAAIPYAWEEQQLIDSPVRWHTGDPETDPWEWRMRVLEERDDIAYSKLFFRTSGYITKEWYPYFLAVRRHGGTFEEAYYDGKISNTAKRIYDIISENGATAFHEIKQLGGFTKEDNSKFERSIVDLQMRMFITMCGRMQKVNKYGENYGWNSTVFTTVEDFWNRRGVALPDADPDGAYEKIKSQIIKLNPFAEHKKIEKFIKG